jgi:putative transposase
MNFYNHRRPHQAMNNQFPMAAWRAGTDCHCSLTRTF